MCIFIGYKIITLFKIIQYDTAIFPIFVYPKLYENNILKLPDRLFCLLTI